MKKLKRNGNIKVKVRKKDFYTDIDVPWRAGFLIAAILIVCFAISDILGFYYGFDSSLSPGKDITIPFSNLNINSKTAAITSLIIGFSAGFEITPVYIAYSIGQKCYGIGSQGTDGKTKKRHKLLSTFLLIFSITATLLAIGGNITYRVMNLLELEDVKINDISFNIVMMIIPIITTLTNLCTGITSWNPYVKDIKNLSKKLATLEEEKRQVDEHKDELESILISNNININNLDNFINTKTETVDKEIDKISKRLKKYVETILSNIEGD